ncbi:MAG: Gfo/Idh/MocA family oxidoreductase [Nanoarchaeota archaeon]|nr:Gfo/Idh/MocA family oxidoreductase [Nanoarchaeota archaeon]
MNKEVRFGLIGCGRIAGKHLDAIKENPNAKLVAVCDKDEALAKKTASENNCDFYTDYFEMLKRDDINIIDICTPNSTHPKISINVANQKKHVLTEKPMSLHTEDAIAMINACNENNVKLFVVKQNRYNPPIVKLREALEKGRFGKLFLGNITVRWARPQEYYDNNEWHGSKDIDGGMLFTQASHHVDMLQWMMGPIRSVQGKIETLNHNIEIEDTAVAILKFDNGALGTIEATTCTYPRNMEGSITLLGEKGTVKVGGMAMNKIEKWEFADYQNDDATIKEVATSPQNVYGFGHKEVIKNIINVLNQNGNEPAGVDGMEGIKSVKIIRAIYESAKTGKEVFL